MNISYNILTEQVILYTIFDVLQDISSSTYTVPAATSWLTSVPYVAPGANTFIIMTIINFQNFGNFTWSIWIGKSGDSQMRPDITQNYVAIHYKPSNPGFGVQGAVDSSTRIHRRKYNTINDVHILWEPIWFRYSKCYGIRCV